MRHQSSVLFWLSHLLIGGLLLLITNLLASPLRAQLALERQPDFPTGLVVLSPQGMVPPATRAQRQAARAALARLDAAGNLGFWAAPQVLAGEQPTLRLSASLLRWG
ncbi:hypothetical protein [Deinococcus multiflagellatus]|uniref:Uncharacterized protein n=2 Tax=Deinococcus multiflagellatus TaxID=1656887 RepID=A0ABW1ZNB6_9DEIO